MGETDETLDGLTDQQVVQNAIAKAASLMTQYVQEEWEELFAPRLNDGEPRANHAGHAGAAASPAPTVEPAPWDVDRPSGGGSGEGVNPDAAAARSRAGDPTPSTEPTNHPVDTPWRNPQPAPRVRLQGTVERAPTFRVSSTGVPQITFPLGEQRDDETVWHSVYATKGYARRIHEQELQPGEVVTLVGIEQETGFYAFGAKRVSADD